VVTFVSVPPCANVTIDWKVASGARLAVMGADVQNPRSLDLLRPGVGPLLPRRAARIATRPVVSATVPASTESRARLRTERWIFESCSILLCGRRFLGPVRLRGVGSAPGRRGSGLKRGASDSSRKGE
jgi:hypothetical protein